MRVGQLVNIPVFPPQVKWKLERNTPKTQPRYTSLILAFIRLLAYEFLRISQMWHNGPGSNVDQHNLGLQMLLEVILNAKLEFESWHHPRNLALASPSLHPLFAKFLYIFVPRSNFARKPIHAKANLSLASKSKSRRTLRLLRHNDETFAPHGKLLTTKQAFFKNHYGCSSSRTGPLHFSSRSGPIKLKHARFSREYPPNFNIPRRFKSLG